MKCLLILAFIPMIFPDDTVHSQEVIPALFHVCDLPDTIKQPVKKKKYELTHELEYSLTSSLLLFMNWQQTESVNRLDLIQNLKLRMLLLCQGSFSFSNSLDHNLGFQLFFDSIPGTSIDDNTLTTILAWKTGKIGSISFNSTLTTRILKGFDYCTDTSGRMIRVMNSSFLTPLVWTFSLGAAFAIGKAGSVTLEVSGAKLTFIRDHSIYSDRGINVFWGVPENRRMLFEYGVGVRLSFKTMIFRRIRWTNDTRLFRAWQSAPDLSIDNELDIKILKHLKLGMRTRILYNKDISNNVQAENLVSLGFCFSL